MSEYSGNREVYERFLDAAAELVMDQYAVSVAEAWDSPAAERSEIPEALDKRCRRLIRKKLSKERRTRFVKKATRLAVAAMLCVVLLFGVAGILFTTVEAVRIPILNFFISQRDGYIEIGSMADPDGQIDSGTRRNTDELIAKLSELMPEGYTLVQSNNAWANNLTVLYKNSLGEGIYFCIETNALEFRVDTEAAGFVSDLVIASHDALLVEKDGYQLLWFDEEAKCLYQLSATSLTQEEIVELARNIEKIL